MPKILSKERLASNIVQIEVEAPLIAKSAKPGQFVVLRINEEGERIPLTLADKDTNTGKVTIIFQEAGASTKLLGSLKVGDEIKNLLGPLGTPAHINKVGHVVVVGGGVGIAEIYPAIKAYKEAGNQVTTIIGARSKELLLSESKLRGVSSEVKVCTDDGSCGQKGFVTEILKEMIEDHSKEINLVYAVGPVPMMEAVCHVTAPAKIKTIVSLNPIMLDATGMCGVCRVTVGGETKFGCVDGPEFDGHLVDFKELKARLSAYKDKEQESSNHVCKLLSKC
ncbi:ferredoxin-NADP reductase [candidate division WOR-1 bacterium RIFOXYA12_FULL_43_27]|uniref:Ferredoxin-NADP reductase n=1 Tax=candidate division WOR-1 bacterium RIFOXYC2_FULL_46_14 TaxID=1802587 RepID=A0A1F4U672_UNCSA|nr:MAG: ferredoxin-NADP reductase [candidate division WOR-1 bacterium RIFOXYA12_FULL_43_27]OGC20613.1 MAG: ferredoxin-NADP reductase [candidate division WOR-1 bacterium RIFOXYB2_FULL_46_45]OGC31650.1 MAG: ferredoxin-NADP reductase [candidate division WOR-1 bacterium RIFOXYA2_FULL_46_56]OGC40454.1 MAG: ferredoxin-NADP reductase [candidate division WOR-1 bacterium RIFOXYC2_FULL_46_14]